MKLKGTIDKHELVKYLAREYARCQKGQVGAAAQDRWPVADCFTGEAMALKETIQHIRGEQP